jgi:L-ascorbate metabolism protein UlaG (beta-lactamase superfamily)
MRCALVAVPTTLRLALALAMLALCLAPRARAEGVEKCPDFIASRSPFLKAVLAADQVRLTFIGHASFLIESPGGVTAVTDYNDYVRTSVVPVIATMNKAHSSHWSVHPDPAIRHVLRGWGEDGAPAKWDVSEGDMRVRNVPTNIRSWEGGTEYDANSIFVFEAAGLCIAHLGHLHHRLTPDHLRELGHVDVALAPVDGSYTMGTAGMIETLKALKAPLVIPMHVFGPSTLARFLDAARPGFEIRNAGSDSIEISRGSLPQKPTVLVLDGR